MTETTAAGSRLAEGAAAAEDTSIHPFRVSIPEVDLVELRRRIAAARWPSKELVPDHSQGVQLATLQELARYWATEHDWRRCEAKLNALPQFTTEIDGVDIHFIHVRSPHEHALPLIITHGWPGSVIELLEVVGPLTDPTAHGGRTVDAFDLVLPSLPGYGFSGDLTRDRIVDNITLYWLTASASSAARVYWETVRSLVAAFASGQPPAAVSLPAAYTVFPDEIIQAPRSWVENVYPNLIYFNEVDKGGHFAAWEEPQLFSSELRAAFRSFR